jgi:hypothetical protein
MPLKQKHTKRNKAIAAAVIAALAALALLYFQPAQHTAEIVLFQ